MAPLAPLPPSDRASQRAARKRARQRQAREDKQKRQALESSLRVRRAPFLEELECARRYRVPDGKHTCWPLLSTLFQRTHPRPSAVLLDRYEAALRFLHRRSPNLLVPENLEGLFELCQHPWLRTLETWRPRGKSAPARLRSLTAHLVASYPLPRFLFSALAVRDRESRASQVALLVHLGRGGSPYKAVKSGLIPAPLTRRMCHALMQTTGDRTIIQATRMAQLRALGCDRQTEQSLLATWLGRRFCQDEVFWLSAMAWFVARRVQPNQVGPLIDYIQHRRFDEPGFAMKGRTEDALVRQMLEWHGHLFRVRQVSQGSLKPSGFTGCQLRRVADGEPESWTVHEILSGAELAQEGRRMKHCVVSYHQRILDARSSIWSLRKGDERQLTVEVHNGDRTIVQIRGYRNRRALPRELQVIRSWAISAGLKLSRGA